MRTRCLTIAFLTASMLILTGCASSPATGMGSTRPVLVAQDYWGDDATLKSDDLIFLVNSKAELEKMGSQDLVKKNVDFTKQSLIVVTLGAQKSPGYWVRITGVQQAGDKIFVQFQANKPAKVDPTATAAAAPYAAVVIPKVSAATLVPEPRYSEGAALPPEPFTNPVMTATAPATMPPKK
jgi:hypothetical protein